VKGHDVLTSSESDEYGTPFWLFNQRHALYWFTLDPCASAVNAKLPKFYTKEDDGLSKSWAGEKVFVNPPYSDIRNWMAKCLSEYTEHNILIECLVPNRSDTRWFHESVAGYATILPIQGRIKFDGGAASATFPSILVTYMPRLVRP
jgi:site-specific DNA-methyltransferase (adenine-specific)